MTKFRADVYHRRAFLIRSQNPVVVSDTYIEFEDINPCNVLRLKKMSECEALIFLDCMLKKLSFLDISQASEQMLVSMGCSTLFLS